MFKIINEFNSYLPCNFSFNFQKCSGRADTERFFREQYCRPIAILKDMQVTSREFAILKAIALFSPSKKIIISSTLKKIRIN